MALSDLVAHLDPDATAEDWSGITWQQALEKVTALEDMVRKGEADMLEVIKHNRIAGKDDERTIKRLEVNLDEAKQTIEQLNRGLESQQQELDRRRARRGYIEQELGKASLTLAEASSIIATLLENVKK